MDTPPWQRHRPPEWMTNRHHKRRYLFRRFAVMFGAVWLIFLVGFAILLGVAYKPLSESIPNLALLLALFCGLPVMIAFTAIFAGSMAFRRFIPPVADVMAAADAVAEGDLSVRVREDVPGEFGRLAKSFNRMAAQLEADEAQRRNLTADVAHELRTPLHIIQGNLEGILDGVYPASPEHISATLEETRLLARLVSDLQTLSLAEAGQLPLHREPVSARDLLEDIQTSFAGVAGEAGVALEIEAPGDEVAVTLSADPDRLEQVLSNLVANALRYTPPGGKIVLRAKTSAETVCLEVADTGRGIPPEDLPHIFDRFWRGDKARGHQDGAGSGLGLAIAKQLVQAHGGKIWAESQPGVGTTFIIEMKRDS
jgi:signal transduction histidine kinase